MTGTVLSGSVAVNDTIEIPSMKVTKKVKSMQMFRKPVEKLIQGDRAGICVTQFDPKHLERGTVCTPGALPTIETAIVSVQKIPYFKSSVLSKAKFHITTGHETVMGRLTFFGFYDDSQITSLCDKTGALSIVGCESFDTTKDYLYQDELMIRKKTEGDSEQVHFPVRQYAVIQFEKPVTCQNNSLVIGSKLDTDIHANMCRIAFHGKILIGMSDSKQADAILQPLKVYKTKVREGLVERVMDEYTVIGKNLFKKETNIAAFTGLKVTLSTGEPGVIEGGFGQSGKIKVRIPGGLSADVVKKYSGGKKKSKGKGSEETANQDEGPSDQQPIKIFLTFKRYIYDPDKKMKQT